MNRVRQVTNDRYGIGDINRDRLRRAHGLCIGKESCRTQDYSAIESLLVQYDTDDTLYYESSDLSKDVPKYIIRYVIFVNITSDRPLALLSCYMGDGNSDGLAKLSFHPSLFRHIFKSCQYGAYGILCAECEKIDWVIHSVGGVHNLIGLMKKTVQFSEIPANAIMYAEKMVIPINWGNIDHLERIQNKVKPEMKQFIEIQLATLRCHEEVTNLASSIDDTKRRLQEMETSAKRLRDNISILEQESQEKSLKLDKALKRHDEIPDRFKKLL